MRACVLIFPGSNCDRDLITALTLVTGRAPIQVWHRDTELPDVDLIGVPGGFTYGDYLRCGAVAARSPIMGEVIRAAGRGVRVLGVCNGFQVLTEAGLLPGALMRNRDLAFLGKATPVSVANAETDFTRAYRPGQVLQLPIAHHDGNYFADRATIDRLEGDGRIVFRYGDNPNGSQNDIAGIIDQRGTVLGMMPHPERATDPALGNTDGRGVFESLLDALGGQVPA